MNYNEELILSKLGNSLRCLEEDLRAAGGLKKLTEILTESTIGNNDIQQLLVGIKEDIVSLKKGQQEILKSNFEIKKAILIQGGAINNLYDKEQVETAFTYLYSTSPKKYGQLR